MEKERIILPKVSWMVLTPRCNNRCRQCYQGNGAVFANSSSDMPFDYAMKVLRFLKELGTKNCILIGGEPTLHCKLNQIINFGSKQGFRMGIITNGSVFSNREKLRATVKSGLSAFTVSIEGPTAEIHDNQTLRKGSFLQAVKAIENGLKEKVTVSSITTVSEMTKNSLIDIYRSMRNIGVKNIVFNVCTPSLDLSNKNCLVSLKEVTERITEVFFFAKNDVDKKEAKIKLVTPLPICLFDKDSVAAMREIGFLRQGCGCQMFHGSGIAFNFNGDILPCCHWIGCSLGNSEQIWKGQDNIPLDDFKEWWHKKEPAFFRKKLASYPSSKCVGCQEWGNHCVGGCPLFWLNFNAQECIPGITKS